MGIGSGLRGRVSCPGRLLRTITEIMDDRHVISQLTTNFQIRSMALTVLGSTNTSRRPIHDRRNMACAEKQLESTVYSLMQERGRWPYLTPRLRSVTDKKKKTATPLIK